MNILVVSISDIHGGAARAAHRLHMGFTQIGLNSVMLVKKKMSDDDTVYQVNLLDDPSRSFETNIIHDIQQNYINQNRTPLSNSMFSFPYDGYDLSELEVVKNADIINLHQVSSFISTGSIKKILALGKPVVWTLHSQWGFTGGCHYSAGCNKYETDCFDCPQLKDDPHHLPNKILVDKLPMADSSILSIVTPSKWMSKASQKSYLFKKLHTEVIPNAIETDIFYPVGNKATCKSKFNIPSNTVTILFGALSGNIKRKGFLKLLEAIETCHKSKKFQKLLAQNRIRILCYGKPSSDIERLRIPYLSFGRITNDNDLRDIYNASDLFVLPSLEDNLPNTMLESMACGIPIIAFNLGGMPDMISNNKNGKLIPPFNTKKFGKSILKLIFRNRKREAMGINAYKLITKSFKLADQAENYKILFQKLLQGRDLHPFINPDFNNNLFCPVDSSLPETFQILANEYQRQ